MRAGRWFRVRGGLLSRRARSERGAASLEYAGGLLVVVTLLSLIALTLGPTGPALLAKVREAICGVGVGVGVGVGAGCGGSSLPAGGGGPEGTSAGGQAGGQSTGGQTKDEGCHGFLGCTWSGIKQVGSGIYNVGKGAYDDVRGIVDLVTHPGKIMDAFQYIFEHPGDALSQLVWDQESRDMWARGDYGGAIGRTLWNVGSWFIPFYDVGKAGAKLSKLAELTKLADAVAELKKIGALADEAGDLARVAREAAERGDAQAAREAAAAAEKKAAEARSEARAEGCPVALGGVGRVGGGVGGGGGIGHFSAVVPHTGPIGGCGDTADATQKAEQQAVSAQAAATKAALPPDVRALVDDAIGRAETGKIRFSGHDGKPYLNSDNALPPRTDYTEWTAAKSGDKRGPHRVIIAGDPAHPAAIYYWDHLNPPIRIGP